MILTRRSFLQMTAASAAVVAIPTHSQPLTVPGSVLHIGHIRDNDYWFRRASWMEDGLEKHELHRVALLTGEWSPKVEDWFFSNRLRKNGEELAETINIQSKWINPPIIGV